MNLQGLWNVDVIPPWAGAYTVNINTQMNYWPAGVANLSECAEPLFRLLRELAVSGARTATGMYHRPGWVAHHNTTIWRDAAPVDNEAFFSFWPMSGGWLCRHLWEHYLFTLDRNFLRDVAWPLMRGASEFYSSWLSPDHSGKLTTPVSTSPENQFRYIDAKGRERAAGVAWGSTLDIAIIRELFASTLEAARILDRDREDPLMASLASQLKRLPAYKIGSKGQLLEYPVEFKDNGPRHDTSPFYPLFPGAEITSRTPALWEAERVLLTQRNRLTGDWPSAWASCCWARLLDSERAWQAFNAILARSTHPNFFNGKNAIFQIDANLGGVAAVAEILLQSHDGEIRLLPALPQAWPNGRGKGLRARGGVELDFAWQAAKITSCRLRASAPGEHRFRLPQGQEASNAKPQPDGTFLRAVAAGDSLDLGVT